MTNTGTKYLVDGVYSSLSWHWLTESLPQGLLLSDINEIITTSLSVHYYHYRFIAELATGDVLEMLVGRAATRIDSETYSL